jgi:hypothetical protein
VGDGGGVRVHHQGGTTIPTSCALILAIGSIEMSCGTTVPIWPTRQPFPMLLIRDA